MFEFIKELIYKIYYSRTLINEWFRVVLTEKLLDLLLGHEEADGGVAVAGHDADGTQNGPEHAEKRPLDSHVVAFHVFFFLPAPFFGTQ